MRAALVDANGLVVNTIVISEGASYAPPDGLTVIVPNEPASIGDSIVNGVVIPQPEPPPIVPTKVTPLQARRALRAAELIDAVNAAVAAAGGDVQDAWEYATEIRRDDPLITAISAGLGLTEQQVDALFIAAASL